MIRLILLCALVSIGTCRTRWNLPSYCRHPEECFPDPRPYCLTTGKMIFGQCELQYAVCEEGRYVDHTNRCICDRFPTSMWCKRDDQPEIHKKSVDVLE